MILNELRKNARVSLLEVAKKTNIPLSTVYDKVRNYEKEIIKKHTSIIDFQNLGYYARRIIALKVKKENKEKIQNFLESHPNVNSLYKINNGFDFLVEIVARNSGVIYDILEEIKSQNGILEKSCFEILEEIKKEDFLIK